MPLRHLPFFIADDVFSPTYLAYVFAFAATRRRQRYAFHAAARLPLLPAPLPRHYA